MAAKPMKPGESGLPDSGIPDIEVTYDVEADVLFITNGKDTVFGDSIANGVAMFYDQDPADAGAAAVAMHIIGAQGALRPFVDAILRQHGVKASQRTAIEEAPAD